MFEYKGLKISWLGHASFRIQDGQTIYIDPFEIKGEVKADIVFITHEHFDHCSLKDLKKIIGPDTIIVASTLCKGELSNLKVKEIKYVKPGDELEVRGIKVKAIPSYNINKFRQPGVPFHPRENQGVGYILNIGGVTIYHTGDSDFIPEMEGLKPDIALIPVSGTYVMTADEAIQAVSKIAPKIAIPMHYGAIVGSEKDAERFSQRVSCKVHILKKEE
ncbi:MAG: MBL fold metallo-hydrolase [Nitrososphaerota archaeon]|nr:MBL fold metallo-hydrolase [Nitrososphaerota archaeon]